MNRKILTNDPESDSEEITSCRHARAPKHAIAAKPGGAKSVTKMSESNPTSAERLSLQFRYFPISLIRTEPSAKESR